MADDERPERGHDDPSLELPSLRSALGFGRRRGRKSASRPDVTARDDPATAPEVDPTAVLPAAALTGPEAVAEPRPRRPPRRPHLHLPGSLVALLTGAIVGLALVGLTSASLQLCSSLRGTSSCGKPGFLLLLGITVAMVLLGSVLLRLAGVEAHGSTSFLGVGLLVVIILLALLPVIFHWWMVIVVPLVAMLTYAAAWWLTTTHVEPGERAR